MSTVAWQQMALLVRSTGAAGSLCTLTQTCGAAPNEEQ
jgi:hypothetical protein